MVNYRQRLIGSALTALVALATPAAAQNPPAIYTKNTALRLPIELDQRARADVAEIKLFVRGPGGKWECVQTAPASHSGFDYRAPGDGEYAFTFATIDRRGVMSPRNLDAVPPHRVVVVDATPPDVTAQTMSLRGETVIQCTVRDGHPDWSTMRAVCPAGDGAWQPLTPLGTDSPSVFRMPPAFAGKVRVTIADRAGNRTTSDFDLNAPAAMDEQPRKNLLDRGRPDPTLMTKDSEPTPPRPGPSTVNTTGFNDASKTPKVDLPPMPALPDLPSLKLPPDNGPDVKVPEGRDYKFPDPPGVTIPAEPPAKMPAIPELQLPDVTMPKNGMPPAPARMPEIPEVAPPPPVATSSALKPLDVPPVPAIPLEENKSVERSGTSHPILNTRTAAINYQLDGGARFAGKIDFWCTADGGRTWQPLKDASGGTPPAKLTLPGDGLYGIRIRPGGGSKPPEPNEDPDCLIEVDATNPVVNLLPPSVGTDAGTMMLSWNASDTNLLGNSISLYYAAKPEGPWEVIVSGYKNEGVYRWTLPIDLKGPVHLRIEAMDRAGNLGRMELPTPVALQAGKQRVKVLGVTPGK